MCNFSLSELIGVKAKVAKLMLAAVNSKLCWNISAMLLTVARSRLAVGKPPLLSLAGGGRISNAVIQISVFVQTYVLASISLLRFYGFTVLANNKIKQNASLQRWYKLG